MKMLIFLIIITSYSLTVILHSLSCFLLWKTYKWNQVTTQQLILLHLSIAEGLYCLLILVEELLFFFLQYGKGWAYFRSISLMLHFVIDFTMFFMTLERLMAVILSFKYQLYWRVGRTKKVLATIWFVGFMFGVTACLIQINTSVEIDILLLTVFTYFQLVFSIIFVVTAFSTYAAIFWKYRKSRNALRRSGSSNEDGKRNSHLRFRIPALIIFTFLIFDSVPLCIWVILLSSSISWSWLLELSRVLLFALGYIADALIYIFLQPEVRKYLLSCCQKRDETEHSTIVSLPCIVVSNI